MMKSVYKNGKTLRYGYTTGSCAAAAAKAAASLLVHQELREKVNLMTPKGWSLSLDVLEAEFGHDYGLCAIKKDSGDDPDITNGILVYARVTYADQRRIYGGLGVGTVTRPGLSVPVGQSAINPVPMQMIHQVLDDIMVDRDFDVEIFIPDGLEVGKKTFNPRLGIEGGISVIGTTGIVEPMSEEAFKDSLALELNQCQRDSLVYAPGNYGRDFCLDHGVDDQHIFKISNFVGFMFEKAVEKGIKKILFVGHIGKLIKVAGGIFHTHSRVSDAKLDILASHLIKRDLDTSRLKEILACNTTDQAVELIYEWGYQAVFDDICQSVKGRLEAFVFDQIQVEVILFGMDRGKIGQSRKSQDLLEVMYE